MNYEITEVWPVNTEIIPDGGIGIDWTGPIGFGQLILFWGEDGKLYADTECLATNDDKDFIAEILKLLPNYITIDQ